MKRGLGKGLDSIIPNKQGTVEKKEETEKIKKSEKEKNDVSRETLVKLTEIEPNAVQPRRKFHEDSLEELSESIKQFGVIQPLILKKKEDHYEIIAGERRFRAARLAGLKEVPAIIREYSDQQVLEIALIENIQREDLNPIEEAQAYQRLIREFKLKQDEVAEKVSKSRSAITNSLRLLKLSKRVQEMLVEEMISGGHARALLALDNAEAQYTLAMRIFDEKLSVREVEKIIRDMQKEKKEPEKEKTEFRNEVIYKDLEEQMKQLLGTKVNIKRKNDNQGKIEIEYYSEEELDRIISFLRK
jgi:ParB family chromosome partitioning protein